MKVVSKVLTDPTVAKAHNAFIMYNLKDYGGAAKEAKGAGKEMYHRLKRALKKESFTQGIKDTKDMYKHPRSYFIKHAKSLKSTGSSANQHDLERLKGDRKYHHPLHKIRTILGHPDFHTTNKIVKDIHGAKDDRDLHKVYDRHRIYKESIIKAKKKKGSASEDFLKNPDINLSGVKNESTMYNKSHPFHMKTDDQLKHIVKHYGRGGVSNPVEKGFYDKQKRDAEDILAKRKRDRGEW